MKLAVSMYSYNASFRSGEMDIPGFIREAAHIGADGVELLQYFYRDVDRDRAAALEALAEVGIPCPIFSVSQNFAKPGAPERREQLEKIKFGVDEAIRFNAQVVRVFAGDVSPGMTFEDAREWIVEGLTEASIYAAEHNVKLALENHGKLAGRGDQVLLIVQEVAAKSGTSSLGANPDTGNFLLVNQISEMGVAEVAQIANMVHFKDFAPEPKGHQGFAYEALNGYRYVGTAVGEGIVNLSACVSALKAANYNGWLSIEYEGEEDPSHAVPRSVQNTRKWVNS
jgi:sugar phosphate isomerase/epimerase